MERSTIVAVACCTATILGCGSTGIVPTGENKYMVSDTDIGDTWSDGNKVLAKLYRDANAFCAERNRVVETISEESAPGRVFVRNASATLRFRCVPPEAEGSDTREDR